jgi:hypothetical protein
MGAIGSILIKAGRLQSITNHEGLLLVPGKNSIWRPLSCFAFAASYGGATSATIDFLPPIGRLLCRARSERATARIRVFRE